MMAISSLKSKNVITENYKNLMKLHAINLADVIEGFILHFSVLQMNRFVLIKL